jgi:circadian clock protein KaiC
MNLEVAELLGSGQISGHGVSFAADNVVYLRYVERAGRLDRAIVVVKARGLEYGTSLCEMSIAADGPRVGRPLSDLLGVLTGLPAVLQVPTPD